MNAPCDKIGEDYGINDLWEDNMSIYDQILEKLHMYRDLPDKVNHFNESFMSLIKIYNGNNELLGKLVDENGLLDLTNFSAAIDKLDMLYDIYDNKEKRFFRLPSKELLLLAAVGLDMYDDLDVLLESAGYNRNMKNLHEFIIYSGLCNYKSLDDIREKLMRYGFRGNKAIDSEHLFDYVGEQSPEELRDYFEELAKRKSKKVKNVLVEAGLISPKWDVTRNRYYSESLSGGRLGPVILTKEQCIRLFEALNLDKNEQLAFMEVLINGHYIIDSDVEELQFMVTNESCELLTNPIKSSVAVGVNDKSIYTTLFNKTVEKLKWEDLDDFIIKNFGQVRSFAVYFDSVFKFEGEKVIGFADRTGLKKTALYEYKNGMCLPEFGYLTLIASMMTKMNSTIYRTLLKKAGKLEFGEYNESPLLVIMIELLNQKEGEDLTFGPMMDVIEHLMVDAPELVNNCHELYATYDLGRQVVFEVLSKDKELPESVRKYFKELGKKKNKEVVDHLAGMSKQLLACPCMDEKASHYTRELLKNRYGFEENSIVVKALQK